jgi:hypothetical protein
VSLTVIFVSVLSLLSITASSFSWSNEDARAVPVG